MPEAPKNRLPARIRGRLKKIFDRAGNDRLKQNFLRAVPFWIASLITGLVAVFYSRVFLLAETYGNSLFRSAHWLLFVITPLCFVIAWWLVVRFEKYAGGSGIPQVMAAIELATPRDSFKIRKLLSIRVIIVKIISSFFMILGGGVIGREGPTIQIAGSVFRKVNQLLPEWWPKISKRNMIMTGAAAGLAAAFNTPLGGIVFAIEELTKTHISYFRTALFTAVIIAGLTAQALFGPYLYLGYPTINGLSPYIFLGVLIVALLSGLGGSITGRILVVIMNWKSRLKIKRQQVAFVLLCGIGVALLGFFSNIEFIGSGKKNNDGHPIHDKQISAMVFPADPHERFCALLQHGSSGRDLCTGPEFRCLHRIGFIRLDEPVRFKHQSADPFRDGRFFNGYHPNPFYFFDYCAGDDGPAQPDFLSDAGRHDCRYGIAADRPAFIIRSSESSLSPRTRTGRD